MEMTLTESYVWYTIGVVLLILLVMTIVSLIVSWNSDNLLGGILIMFFLGVAGERCITFSYIPITEAKADAAGITEEYPASIARYEEELEELVMIENPKRHELERMEDLRIWISMREEWIDYTEEDTRDRMETMPWVYERYVDYPL